jgi:hypothetical protein
MKLKMDVISEETNPFGAGGVNHQRSMKGFVKTGKLCQRETQSKLLQPILREKKSAANNSQV